VPLVENVRLMVVNKNSFGYLQNAGTAPTRKLAGFYLCLGVRDANGQQTPLASETLSALGISFEKTLDEMIARIPSLPVIDMGRLSTGDLVVGFRGTGAIDQLASTASLRRLHETLGDPYVLHVHSHGPVAATIHSVPKTVPILSELIELADPRPPNVIMTRGTPDFVMYKVSAGKLAGAVPIQAR
jgi:hypothetical protein